MSPLEHLKPIEKELKIRKHKSLRPPRWEFFSFLAQRRRGAKGNPIPLAAFLLCAIYFFFFVRRGELDAKKNPLRLGGFARLTFFLLSCCPPPRTGHALRLSCFARLTFFKSPSRQIRELAPQHCGNSFFCAPRLKGAKRNPIPFAAFLLCEIIFLVFVRSGGQCAKRN